MGNVQSLVLHDPSNHSNTLI